MTAPTPSAPASVDPAAVGQYAPPGPAPHRHRRRQSDGLSPEDVAATVRVFNWLRKYPKIERLLWVAGTWFTLSAVKPEVVQHLTGAVQGDAEVAAKLTGLAARMDSGTRDRAALHTQADSIQRELGSVYQQLAAIRDDLRIIRCAIAPGPLTCGASSQTQPAARSVRTGGIE